MSQYYPPLHATSQYHCPHCDVYAKQRWSHLNAIGNGYIYSNISNTAIFKELLSEDWTISLCEHCSEVAIWHNDSMIYPKKIIVNQPNSDLDEDIRNDYLEAAHVYSESPRAAAALLRLALQKLCVQLGEKGKDINTDIGELVKKGLSPQVQKSLDTLRIVGNNAVHPGQINLREEPEKVLVLFKILNLIADKMITEPRELAAIYDSLPHETKEAVVRRDADVSSS